MRLVSAGPPKLYIEDQDRLVAPDGTSLSRRSLTLPELDAMIQRANEAVARAAERRRRLQAARTKLVQGMLRR